MAHAAAYCGILQHVAANTTQHDEHRAVPHRNATQACGVNEPLVEVQYCRLESDSCRSCLWWDLNSNTTSLTGRV